MTDPVGIGRYRIVSVLGRGAMGVVYRAHDPEIDRPVAIKLIHANLLSGEEQEEFVARFRREAQAAARCAHPNVVGVYDFALHDENPFLAMEFVDGQALSALRQGNAQLQPSAAVPIIRQVLAGLAAAHAAGITHRDVKPANIMLTRSGAAKIADFGISRLESSSLTAAGMMVGTPSYMSPEQSRGDPVDPRSDLYSTAVVLYELLAGSRPFAGSSAGALYLRLTSEDAPDIRGRVPGLPEPIAAAVMRGLSRDPAARFPTAAAMSQALAAGPTETDLTVVLPDRPAHAAPAQFDPSVIAAVERRLAEHLGPIARHLVQSAIRRAPDLDSLYAALASKIDSEPDRARFTDDLRAAHPTTSAQLTAAPPAAIEPAALEQLQTALALHLGPVARLLIKRAKSTTLPSLWQELALHIDQKDARAAFLRSAPAAATTGA